MDYWKEAEKIYNDLERKGYRMEFYNGDGDEHYYSCIYFREQDAERNDYFLTWSFDFPIERLSRCTYWEVEKFINTEIFVHDKTRAKQLFEYLINEFKFDCSKTSGYFACANRCREPLKLFHFYVTVAQKYYSSIISKAKEIVIEEG